MSNCNGGGSLSSIRSPQTPEDCGCECTPSDLTYSGQSYECADVSPGNNVGVVLDRILDKLCDIDAEITVTDIDWGCIPNTTAPTGGTVTSNLQFIADELIPRSGNDCNCPVTNNIYFTDTYGIVQCDGGQDSGYLKFSGDYALLNADTQARISADLKIDNGFGAGYTEISSSTNLSVVNTDQLNYSYGIDATGGGVTLTLTQIAAASLDHKNRRFSVRRLDCTVANTVTIQAYSGETIEGAGSITLGVGHGYIIQADDATNDWVIVAEYFGGCDAIEQQNNGNVFMNYKLGVGDSTPDAKVDISNATTTDVTLIVENTGAASADLVQVIRNGTTIDVFDEAGRLHVGGSNPSAELHVTGEGATSATYSLIAEDSAGLDHFTVRNDGEVVIRDDADQKIQFTGGNINFVTDAGVVRDVTIQADDITLTARINTSVGISPAASATDTYYDIAVAATASSGTNDLKIFDIAPIINLTGTATGNLYGVYMDATITSMTGTLYSFVSADTTAKGGVGTSTPNSTWQVNGSFGTKVTSVAATTTLDATHSVIIFDTTTGSLTCNLPTAVGIAGRQYTIIKSVAANTLTIDGSGGETISGSATVAMNNQYSVRTIVSDGSNWYTISSI